MIIVITKSNKHAQKKIRIILTVVVCEAKGGDEITQSGFSNGRLRNQFSGSRTALQKKKKMKEQNGK